jgi:hypothetical protein
VVGSPCPMLRWPGCARRSQEPRPRALRYKRQGQLPLGACWFREVLGFVWGEIFFKLFIISYRECVRC